MTSLLLTGLGVNAFFILFHPANVAMSPQLPPILRSLQLNLALFVVPAIGWSLTLQSPGILGYRLLQWIAVSTSLFVSALVIIMMAGSDLSLSLFWNVLWVLANLGFVWAGVRRRSVNRHRTFRRREVAAGGALFLTAYAWFFWGGTRVVPSQADQDLEVLGTGFGLLTRFEPLLLTDRNGVYFFAHPPLLHIYVAGSFLMHGALDELRFYDTASQAARDVREGRAPNPLAGPIRLPGSDVSHTIDRVEGGDYVLAPVGTGPPVRASVQDVELARIYERYRQYPHRQEARAPNFFFAALTVALLGLWTARRSRRAWCGLLVATTYATSAEVFVRSSYGGYFAIGSFISLLILIWAVHQSARRTRRGSWGGVTGALAALADHKLVVLPLALWGHRVALRWRDARRGNWLQAIPVVVLGFAAGTICFWAWGLTIAPAAFIQDHVLDHLLQRIAHVNPLGYGGYPTAAGLWAEFSRHTGYVLVPAGVALIAWDAWRHPAGWLASPQIGWLAWIATAAIAFTLVDWRMTKHIIPILLPVLVGLAPGRRAPTWRVTLAGAVLLVAIAFNAVAVAGLVRNFESFVVSPGW